MQVVAGAAAALTAAGHVLVIRFDLLKRTQAAGVPARLQKRALAQAQGARNSLTTAFKWRRHAAKLHAELGMRADEAQWLRHRWFLQHADAEDPECKRMVQAAMDEVMGSRMPSRTTCHGHCMVHIELVPPGSDAAFLVV